MPFKRATSVLLGQINGTFAVTFEKQVGIFPPELFLEDFTDIFEFLPVVDSVEFEGR